MPKGAQGPRAPTPGQSVMIVVPFQNEKETECYVGEEVARNRETLRRAQNRKALKAASETLVDKGPDWDDGLEAQWQEHLQEIKEEAERAPPQKRQKNGASTEVASERWTLSDEERWEEVDERCRIRIHRGEASESEDDEEARRQGPTS